MLVGEQFWTAEIGLVVTQQLIDEPVSCETESSEQGKKCQGDETDEKDVDRES